MDYQKFYTDVVAWINEVNQMAMKFGMDSNEFWNWAAKSTGELSDKYQNNKLVVKQMSMLYIWLEEVYEEGKSKRR